MNLRDFWVYQQGALWVTDLQAPDLPARVEPRIEARFEEAGPASANSLAQAMGHGDEGEIRQRLNGRGRCFVARVEGEIASYCWSSWEKERVGEMERVIRLQRGEAYVWGCATLPPFRRQHLYTALLTFISRRLAGDGVPRIWIGADRENTPSLRAFDSAGFRPVARMTYARLLGFSALFIRGVPQAPRDLVAAARHLFTMPGERRWGPLAVGWGQAT